MKKYCVLFMLCICPMIVFGQLKITSNGKASAGKNHTLDNGRLKIGNDGAAEGLSFYDSQSGGTDFRIFRSGNVAYLTRGGSLVDGIRMSNTGGVTIGKLTGMTTTPFDVALRVYAENGCPMFSFGRHNFDGGAITASLGYRELSAVYAGSYIDSQGTWNRTFWVLANGDIYSRGSYVGSDSIFKRDIATIPNALDKVLNLRGITFYSKPMENRDEDFVVKENVTENDKESGYQTPLPETVKQINAERKRKKMGVVAQEVEAVVPEVVRTQPDGTKAVAYSELIGLLIEAMKEQQTQIEKQQVQLEEQKELINQLIKAVGVEKPVLKDIGFDTEVGIESVPLLMQNTPNPFNQATEIGYYIPENVNSANIYIYDINGFQQRNISISERGKGATILQASALQAGIYFYALICDGKQVDTKQMILTR